MKGNKTVNNVHKNCFNFNRRTFLNYGFPETPENMLFDRLLCIYALMYKCSIKTVVIIEEVKKSDKVQGLGQSPWVSWVSACLVSKTFYPLSSL